MNARFFYADACYNTWPKLYVLTEDGKLFSRYLFFMEPATDTQHVDFHSFKASDYSWGGYQSLKEISYSKAIETKLRCQPNWVAAYMRNHGS
jgi:hypothetical protein